MKLRFAASLRADDGRKARPEPSSPEPARPTLPIAEARPTVYEVTVPASAEDTRIVVSFVGELVEIRAFGRRRSASTGRPST
jgi:hypothetical protein